MGNSPIAAVVLACGLGAASCTDDQDPAGASELLSRVRGEGYRAWARPPGWEVRRPTSAPHAEDVDLYVNAILGEAIDAGAPLAEWPVGSIVAKDGFEDDELCIIALMEKREDGWFFAEYDSDGDSFYSGAPDICTGCHTRYPSDRIRAFPLPR